VARALLRLGVDVDAPRSRDTEEVLAFRDPDGMGVELVATEGDHRSGWDGVADIPAEHAVRGLHAVTLSEQQREPSARDVVGADGARPGRRGR
jgi:glyoxalase family protein